MSAASEPWQEGQDTARLLDTFAICRAAELARGGATGSAQALLRPLLERASPPVECLDLQARICAQAGDAEGASRAWRTLLQQQPEHPGALAGVASIQRLQRRALRGWRGYVAPVLAVLLLLGGMFAVLQSYQRQMQSLVAAGNAQAAQGAAEGALASASLGAEMAGIKDAQRRMETALARIEQANTAALTAAVVPQEPPVLASPVATPQPALGAMERELSALRAAVQALHGETQAGFNRIQGLERALAQMSEAIVHARSDLESAQKQPPSVVASEPPKPLPALEVPGMTVHRAGDAHVYAFSTVPFEGDSGVLTSSAVRSLALLGVGLAGMDGGAQAAVCVSIPDQPDHAPSQWLLRRGELVPMGQLEEPDMARGAITRACAVRDQLVAAGVPLQRIVIQLVQERFPAEAGPGITIQIQ